MGFLKGSPRLIGHLGGNSCGPTIIFFGGIHGNEPAGIKALHNVFSQLKKEAVRFSGNFFGIAGNLSALAKDVRFIDDDLNRIWGTYGTGSLSCLKTLGSVEGEEMSALHMLIDQILETASPPFYFIDLHTTSGRTEPFMVMNDSLLNRRFAQNFPLPKILGIEEYLTGALLSYINDLGYIALGFESGQHKDTMAITNAEYFVRYTLGLTGFYPMDKNALNMAKGKLSKSQTPKRFFEIYHQHRIKAGETFKMKPGFVNFQAVTKGTVIALYNNKPIITDKMRQLFMPLYQDKGYEGFYFIRSIPPLFLWLSKYMRKLKVDSLLTLLPGVKWASIKKKHVLHVDRGMGRFFLKSVFHLLGYRTREVGQNHWALRNREQNSRGSEYRDAPWR